MEGGQRRFGGKEQKMGLYKLHSVDSIVSIRVRNTLFFAPYLETNMIMILVRGGVKSSEDTIKLRPKMFFSG